MQSVWLCSMEYIFIYAEKIRPRLFMYSRIHVTIYKTVTCTTVLKCLLWRSVDYITLIHSHQPVGLYIVVVIATPVRFHHHTANTHANTLVQNITRQKHHAQTKSGKVLALKKVTALEDMVKQNGNSRTEARFLTIQTVRTYCQ